MAIGHARFRKCFPGSEKRNIEKSRRNFKIKLRKLRKSSKQHIRNLEDERPEERPEERPDAGAFIPISLARRAVLRSESLVNVELLLALQRVFRKQQSLLNEMMIPFAYDESTCDEMAMWRLAVQTGAEESLKTASQLARVFSPDAANIDGFPELLALCEQFYEEHGLPNAAEKALLSQAGNQPYVDIDRWFIRKKYRLTAYRVFEGQWQLSMLRDLDTNTSINAWKPKKPIWRH